jgi:hypothetical protein
MHQIARVGFAILIFISMLGPVGAYAGPTFYADRAAFLTQVGGSFTDDYTAYNPGVFTNAAMSAVLGETSYETLSFPDLNIVGNVFQKGDGSNYCAGCNGNFRLTFGSSSFSNGTGVYAVAVDIILNKSSDTLPQLAGAVLISFADGATQVIMIPPIGYDPQSGMYKEESYFLGFSDSRGIASMTIGTEPLSQRHFWVIDNLTIGSAPPAVSEPAALFLFGLGFAAIGYPRRRPALR